MRIKVLENNIYRAEPSVLIITKDKNILINAPKHFDRYLTKKIDAIYLTHGHDMNIEGISKIAKHTSRPNSLINCHCSKITQRHVERIWKESSEYVNFKIIQPFKKNELGMIPIPAIHQVQQGYDFHGFILEDTAFITPIYDIKGKALKLVSDCKYIVTGVRYITLTKYQDNQSLTQIIKRYKDIKTEKIALLGISNFAIKHLKNYSFRKGEEIDFTKLISRENFIEASKEILIKALVRRKDMDEKNKKKEDKISKPAPEVTENYIRWRVMEPNLFIQNSFRTMDLSKKDGIKSVIGKLKADNKMHMQSVLFDKKKWTVDTARVWMEGHRDSLKSYGLKKLILKSLDLPKQEVRSGLADKMIERVLGVSVFKQEKITKIISPYQIAIYSKALQNFYISKENKIIDLKWGDSYIPAAFELLETKRDKEERLLISGYILVEGKQPIVLHFRPGFRCQILTAYCRKVDLKYMEEVLQAVHEYVKDNNYYKNEKVTPFGTFLPLKSIAKSDVILDEKTLERLDKTVFNFFNNKKKYDKAKIPFKRGVVFAGIPGTGKTLYGKVIMNSISDVTFIWVTAKDFKSLPTEYLFDMARELQPSILFIEDVDRVLNGSTLDTIKTQMDGLESNEGILTILSTNFPEELPKTLIDRPGRFDDVVEFNLPDKELRFKILMHYGREMGIDDREKTLSQIAEVSKGLTPAHLKEILVSAYMSRELGPLDLKDLKNSLERIQQIHDKFKRD